ncbi:MAG: hypothetical protein IKL52_02245 [Candidatus Gastranaerophilales bacterium]|nr:hypothetical protein [Candidatus Gastranaerophilales bacterium]
MDKAQNYMIEAQNSANNSQASYLNAKTIEESISKFQQLENQITVGLNSKANLNLANSVPDSSFVAKCTSWLMPDTSKGVQIASYPYTTPDLGWIIGYTNATTSTYLYMYLDEKPIGAEADDYINIAVPVSKGQVLTASTTSIKQRQLYFYPMKGKA